MTEIALYDILRRIPDTTDNEAKEAVADIANSKEVSTKSDIKYMATKSDIKDMATKSDLKAGLAELETRVIEKISDQEARLTKLIYSVAAINIGVVISAVGLMIKFL